MTGSPMPIGPASRAGRFKTGWAAACRRAGLIKWRRNEGAGAALIVAEAAGACSPVRWSPCYTPHDLRHTWATWFYAATKDLLLLKDEGGWRTLKMVERYTHLMPSDLVPEIASIWGASHPQFGALPIRAASVQVADAIGKTA